MLGGVGLESGQQIECGEKSEAGFEADKSLRSQFVISADCHLMSAIATYSHLIGQSTDLSPDSSLSRLTDASAGDSCENVKVGSGNRSMVRHLDHLRAAAPPRVE